MSLLSNQSLAAILATASLLSACANSKAKPSTYPIQELRAEARARHLHFQVNSSILTPGQYLGRAWHEGDTALSMCVEKGAMPKWTTGYQDSQKEAAEVLLKKIKGKPTEVPESCPEDISQ